MRRGLKEEKAEAGKASPVVAGTECIPHLSKGHLFGQQIKNPGSRDHSDAPSSTESVVRDSFAWLPNLLPTLTLPTASFQGLIFSSRNLFYCKIEHIYFTITYIHIRIFIVCMYILTNNHNVDTQWNHHDPGKETKLSRSPSTPNTNQNLLPIWVNFFVYSLGLYYFYIYINIYIYMFLNYIIQFCLLWIQLQFTQLWVLLFLNIILLGSSRLCIPCRPFIQNSIIGTHHMYLLIFPLMCDSIAFLRIFANAFPSISKVLPLSINIFSLNIISFIKSFLNDHSFSWAPNVPCTCVGRGRCNNDLLICLPLY